jgi:cardiolipin synthase (CMP-forming)
VKREFLRNLPNLLSVARLLAAPALFWFLWSESWRPALAVLACAAITDALDGFVARRFDAASRAGEILDPVADKVLISGAFLGLALNGGVEKWLAGLVVGRDALILLVACGGLLRASRRRFPPSLLGKASTIFQAVFLIALVAALASAFPQSVLAPLKWSTAAFTALSGADYARRTLVKPLAGD